MHAFLITLFLLLGSPQSGLAIQNDKPTDLRLPKTLPTKELPFLSHTGPGPFDNALALNVAYEPVEDLRKQIVTALNVKLENFRGWNPAGEAHVTVVTPPEYFNVLRKFLTMKDIEQIAQAHKIQESDLLILGLGRGKKTISGKEEDTYFLIVESNTLRTIRTEIWRAYVTSGGNPGDWDPTWFFPHITVGYTKQDLHEPDVLKNVKFSYDTRFRSKSR